jgi:23S rRNA (uracil1939-C5)-methyltransferase
VATRRTPAVRLGVHQIALPPGGFLQPSAEGEVHLVKLVREALADAPGPFVDLFAGAGTFALPLSAAGKVTAFDAEKDAVAALNAARNPAVAAHRRDLFREPLTPLELNAFGAAVLDPPRAGAAAQSQALALSKIARIAYVSCNLATFARDAAILTGGGHWLVSATPVDQFVWSPHVELVGMFARSEG